MSRGAALAEGKSNISELVGSKVDDWAAGRGEVGA